MIQPQHNRVHNVQNTTGISAMARQRQLRQTNTPDSGRHHFGDKQTVEQSTHFVDNYTNDKNSHSQDTRYPELEHLQERRPIHKERFRTSSPKLGRKFGQVDLTEELFSIKKIFQKCHQDFASNYMKSVIRDIDIHKSANADEVVALKELFQQLTTEMVHLRTLLSAHSEIGFKTYHGQVDNAAVNSSNTSSQNRINHANTNDFVHFNGPLTESTIVQTLQERFDAHYYHTNIGPVLLSVNPFGLSESEKDIHQKANSSPLLKNRLLQALHQMLDTQTSQILILSGQSGSGKSFTAQVLIHQLFDVTCGGVQTDLAKQLVASVTVLQSFGKARTINNADSSRVAKLYEFHFSNRIISKAKIHCYPLDMSRIVRSREGERNFHIFYQLFAGLSPKDRAKLQLQTHSAHELRYLYNYPASDQFEIEILRNQFQLWKLALSVLGIPFADVTRVLAAILLLGNVHFMEKSTSILDVQGGDFELKAVAVLLGVPYTSLFRGLSKRSKLIRGEITVLPCTAAQANSSRDALSKALYSRTLSAIVRRCNSSRKPVSSQESSPNSSSESLSKATNTFNLKIQQDRLNISDNTSSLPSPVNSNSDKIIGIADLFGFESSKSNGMEQICCNLCSETIHHFYTAHIFKSTERYCREAELDNMVDVDYTDNSLCIELLTCQPTGILTYLDRETLDLRSGSPEAFMDKLHSKHRERSKFHAFSRERLEFGIVHHAGEVVYDAKELFFSNDDSIVDDAIRIFSKQNCNFGFVTHLFANDQKVTLSRGNAYGEDFVHNITQSSGVTESNQSISVSAMRTFSQDFQSKLDGLLETLVRAQPWFILCIKPNFERRSGVFDREMVSKQTKSLQIFDTVYLVRSGYTHRMRILPFAQRYFAFQDDRLTQEDAMDIVRSYQSMILEERKENPNKIFFVGKKHVLFSELVWQRLERDRREKEADFASRHNIDEQMLPSPERELCYEDSPTILVDEVTEAPCVLAEMDVSTPPPIPKRRSYTVVDNKKIGFPQIRIMKNDYRDTSSGTRVVFNRGETVKVVGASPKAGFLTVETRNKTGWVPYKLTELLNDSS